MCLWGRLSRATNSCRRTSSDGSFATSSNPRGVNRWSNTFPPSTHSRGSDLIHDSKLLVCSKSPYTKAVLPLKRGVRFWHRASSSARVAILVGMTCALFPFSASLSLRLLQALVSRSPKWTTATVSWDKMSRTSEAIFFLRGSTWTQYTMGETYEKVVRRNVLWLHLVSSWA